ncbi:MAG: DUF3857 domain-containing protein [Planctomycetes bacterium]|nr:DUF3857 domain-containing protein [Planctomycetota bacterium]
MAQAVKSGLLACIFAIFCLARPALCGEAVEAGANYENNAEALEKRDELMAAQMEYSSALKEVAKVAAEGGEDSEALWCRAEFLTEKIFDLTKTTGNNEDASATYKGILDSCKEAVPPLLSARMRWNTARLEVRRGLAKEAAASLEPLGLMREWLICGPFDNERGRNFDTKFGPEQNPIDTEVIYDDGKRPTAWRKFTSKDPLGRIPLAELMMPNTESLAYALCLVQSPADVDAALRFGSDDGMAIWVNGQEIFRNALERESDLDQGTAGFKLRKGWNSVLLKISQVKGDWNFISRITATSGAPLPGLKFESDPARIKTLAASISPAAPGGELPDVDKGAVSYFAELLQENPQSYREAYYLGYLLMTRQHLGRHQIYDRQLLSMAAQMAKTNSLYYLTLARASENTDSTEADREENQKREALGKAIDIGGDEVAALVRLAEYYFYSMDNVTKSEDYLKKALAIAPLSLSALMLDYDMYRRQGWTTQAREIAEKIVRRSSFSVEGRIRLGEVLSLTDRIPEAIGSYKFALGVDATEPRIVRNLYNLYLRSGKLDEAAKLLDQQLKLFPYDKWAIMEYAGLRRNEGKYDEALALVSRRLSICPEDHEALALKGHIFKESGKNAEAAAEWKKALRLQPTYPELKKYLAALTGEGEENGNETNLAEYVASFGKLDPQPGQDRYTLIDEMADTVNADGTRTKSTHKVVKALTREGAEDLARTRIYYNPEFEEVTLQSARILHPDGQISQASSRNFNLPRFSVMLLYLPSIAKGDIIELKYSVDRVKQDFFGDYFAREYFFAKPSPVKVARYILTSPISKEIHFHTIGNTPNPTTVTDNAAGTITRTWEMRDLAPIENEVNMPPEIELSPCVQVSTFKDWDSLAKWYHHLILPQNQITPEIRKKLKELTAGKSDDEKIAAILQFVSHEIRNEAWSFGVHGYKPYKAEAIFTRRFGDCKDKSTMINIMARELGFEAWPVLVFATDPGDPVPGRGKEDLTLPMLGHFNHCISKVITPERTYILDGTISYRTPEGTHYTTCGGKAVVVAENGSEMITIPPQTSGSNLWDEKCTVVIEPNGGAEFTQSLLAKGNPALHLRAYFRNPAVRNLVMRKIADRYYGPSKNAEVVFDDVNAGSDAVSLSGRFRVGDYCKTDGDMIEINLPKVWLQGELQKGGAIPGDLFDTYARYSTRSNDIILPMVFAVRRHLTITWPADWEMVGTIEPVNIETEFGVCRINFSKIGSSMTINSAIELKKPRINKADYPEFRRMCILADRIASTTLTLEKK